MTKEQEKTEKELIEIIGNSLHDFAYFRRWDDRETCDLIGRAEPIAKKLAKLGYRKPPYRRTIKSPPKPRPQLDRPKLREKLETLIYFQTIKLHPEGSDTISHVLTKEEIDAIVALIDKPKDKPPLLSDEEIEKVWRNKDAITIKEAERNVAQAQREADIKHYEGG